MVCELYLNNAVRERENKGREGRREGPKREEKRKRKEEKEQ